MHIHCGTGLISLAHANAATAGPWVENSFPGHVRSELHLGENAFYPIQFVCQSSRRVFRHASCANFATSVHTVLSSLLYLFAGRKSISRYA